MVVGFTLLGLFYFAVSRFQLHSSISLDPLCYFIRWSTFPASSLGSLSLMRSQDVGQSVVRVLAVTLFRTRSIDSIALITSVRRCIVCFHVESRSGQSTIRRSKEGTTPSHCPRQDAFWRTYMYPRSGPLVARASNNVNLVDVSARIAASGKMHGMMRIIWGSDHGHSLDRAESGKIRSQD